MSAKAKCERCGRVIPPERLEMIPDTRVCVGCAGAMGGSEFAIIPIEERTSKQESYKGRHALTAVAKVRKPIPPMSK